MDDLVLDTPRSIPDALKYVPVQRQATACRIVGFTYTADRIVVRVAWVDSDGEFSVGRVDILDSAFDAVTNYSIKPGDVGKKLGAMMRQGIRFAVKASLGIAEAP